MRRNMVNLFIITTFLLITGGKTAPDHDLGAIVKQLELKVDQALRDLTTQLAHTKKRIYDLEEQPLCLLFNDNGSLSSLDILYTH